MASGPRAAIAWAPAAWGWPSPRSEQLRGTGVPGWRASTLWAGPVPVLMFFLFFFFVLNVRPGTK